MILAGQVDWGAGSQGSASVTWLQFRLSGLLETGAGCVGVLVGKVHYMGQRWSRLRL
jgi:hypothetical protein